MKIVLFFSIIFLSSSDRPLLTQEEIAEFNSKQSFWKAAENWLTRMPLSLFKSTYRPSFSTTLFRGKPRQSVLTQPIPTSFDASVTWPNCVIPVSNQSDCSNGYAFAVTAVISERMCISSPSLYKGINFSPQYLTMCNNVTSQCNGGFVHDAWVAMINYGTVLNNCQPWTNSRTCSYICQNGTPATVFKASPSTVYEAYSVTGIQQEILSGGSVSAGMTVYLDFMSYSSGIYVKYNNTIIGNQVVKIFGWGVSGNGTNYWICANSFGTEWGMSGLFWIQFGQCGIDALGVIGTVDLS